MRPSAVAEKVLVKGKLEFRFIAKDIINNTVQLVNALHTDRSLYGLYTLARAFQSNEVDI